MHVLSFDPSGNFTEGKGTSGICYVHDGKPTELGELKAQDYESAEAYWNDHILVLSEYMPTQVVVEGYRLYNHKGNKADMQANSTLETPQLIGAIRLWCYQNHRPLTIQYAAEAKPRWKESVLVHKGYLTQKGSRYYFNDQVTSTHKRDALKHALHFMRYAKTK